MLPQNLLLQLHQIGQTAEKYQKDILQNRFVPDEIIRQLKMTEAFRLWVAKDYGGLESHVLDLMEAVQTLSYYNGSLGWILGVTGTAALGSGYMEKETAQTVFGDTLNLTGGWAAPAGRAVRTEGGILVSGKWSWGSGIRYCTHIVGGVLLMDKAQEHPVSALAYFRPEQVTFVDNWEVLGLNGTNSIDYEVKDAFVPDGQWIYFPVQQPVINRPLYRFSFLGALSVGVASVALGLARRAIYEIKTLALQKTPNGARKTLAQRPMVHEKVALLEAKYQSGKLFLEEAVASTWAAAEEEDVDTNLKSTLRLASAFAANQCLEVVQTAYQLGGGSSIWEGVKLQELLKDIHVVSQHAMVSPNNYEIAGRVMFNQKVNEWLL